VAGSLSEAFRVAETVEFLAMVYSRVLSLGEPRVLTDEEVDQVLEAFKSYGPSRATVAPFEEG